MVKVDILSGFLGAGKTTLIQKLLKEALAGKKVVLIENEFGEIVELWEDEKSFLGSKLSSFRDGADPQKMNLVAKAGVWQTMSEFAKKFLQESYVSDSFELEI